VIQSFNEDTPYDRFIKSNSLGPSGKDAATGPRHRGSAAAGQIERTMPPNDSLARCDGEIIINTSEAFLG